MKPKPTLRSFLSIAGSTLLAIPSLHAATYYWDNNGAANGFGPAGGSWATGASLWNADTDGNPGPTGTITTNNSSAANDAVNFGNGATGLGAGSITVSGSVNSGSMTFASGSGAIVLSTGTIALSAIQTTTVDNASNTIESILAGAATSFTKAGSGSLILTGANSYTGSTIVNSGTLNLGGGTTTGSLASAGLTLSGGAFHYTRSDNATQTFTTTNINSRSSAISVSAGNILNLGTVTRGTGGTFDFSSTGAGILSALATSNVAGIMPGLTLGDSWAVAMGPGVAISALGSYTLTSVEGTAGANYNGDNIDVDNSAGTLDAAITANSVRFSEADANTLDLATGTNTISSSAILVGSAVGANLSTISGGTLTGAVGKDLNIIQNNASGELRISSTIANNTSTSITKSGAGVLTLAGNNTFTGGLNIHAGGVKLGNAGALNSGAGIQNAVTLTGGSSVLALNGNSVVVRSLDASAGTMVVENANLTPATLTIGNSANANSTIAGLIQDGTGGGALGLIKTGTGTLALSNASNSYTGGTSINAGSLQPVAAALGSSANTITFTGNGALIPVYGSTPTFTQGIVINPGVTGQLNAANQFYNFSVSGAVGGTGTLLVAGTDNSNGGVTLSNTANGHTGIIRIGSTTITGNLTTASIKDEAGAGAIQLGGTTGVGNLTFSGTSAPQPFATRQVALTGTTGGGTITNNGALANIVTFTQNLSVVGDGNKMLTLGGSNAGLNRFGGNIANGNVNATTDVISLTKTNDGTWALGGTNTYSGATLMNAGNGTLIFQNATQSVSANTSLNFAIANNQNGTMRLLSDTSGTITLGNGMRSAAGGTSGTGTMTIFVGNNSVANGGNGAGGTTDSTIVLGTLDLRSNAEGGLVDPRMAARTGITGANGYRLQIGDVILQGQGTTSAAGAYFNPTSAPLTITGTVKQNNGRLATNAVANQNLTLDGTAGGNLISGAIKNATDFDDASNANALALNVVKSSTSNWTLSGANTYNGITTITSGTLAGIGTNAFGNTTDIRIAAANTATLSLRGDSSTEFKRASDSVRYAVTTTANGATINVDQATIAGTAPKTMTIGALAINNAITNGTNFTGANNTSLSIGAVTTSAAVGGTETLTNSIAGSGSLTLASIAVTRTGTPTLAFAGTGTTTVTGAISQVATTALTKSGAGTLTLEGANSYSGPTAINGGTLFLTGATQSTSAITFSGGGILGLKTSASVAATSTSINFTGQSVLVTGPTGLPSYTLLTAVITGTEPALAVPVPGYELDVVGNQLRLVQTGAVDPFLTWSGAADFNVDSNNDGVDNGMAWLLGAADKNVSAVGLLPELDDSDPTYFIFTYRRADSANGDPNTTIRAEYGTTLASWATAVDNDDIDIIVTDNHYSASPGVDRVQVKLKRSTLAPGGKLFARLKVTQP